MLYFPIFTFRSSKGNETPKVPWKEGRAEVNLKCVRMVDCSICVRSNKNKNLMGSQMSFPFPGDPPSAVCGNRRKSPLRYRQKNIIFFKLLPFQVKVFVCGLVRLICMPCFANRDGMDIP